MKSIKDKQFYKFAAYGFLKNLRFFDAFLLLFFLENGLSYTQIGIVYSIREITINFTEIPSGLVADSYGRKYALVGSFLLYITSFLLFYFSVQFHLFAVGMFLYGMADAFRSGTHKGMIMDYLELKGWSEYKVQYYGETRSWSQKGSAISALIAGVLVFYSGSYRQIFLFSVIPYGLNFINILSYPADINFSRKLKSSIKRDVFFDFYKTVKQGNVFSIIYSSAVHSSFLKAIKDYIQPIMVHFALILPFFVHFEDKKRTGIMIGIFYFLIFLMTSFASKKAYWFVKLKPKSISKITLLVGLGMGIFCGIFYFFEWWVGALLTFSLIYGIENIRKPILTGALSDNVSNENLTSILSAQSFLGTILTSIFALGLGMIADVWGIGLALIVVGCCALGINFGLENGKT